MIKGPVNKESTRVEVEDVLSMTNGGYDVYMLYLGKVGSPMQRPWGKKENKLSWGIYLGRNGIWTWKDQATEETGNAIHFIQRYLGLSFIEALNKIVSDFGIEHNAVTKPVVTWEVPTREEYSHIAFIDQPFKDYHHEFWNCVEVTEDDCRANNCYAVKSLALNRRIINIKKNEPVFAYYAPDSSGVKIYFPTRPENRFLTNLHYKYLWNYANLKPCDKLIIQKSVKDLIVTSMLMKDVIATQAEGVKIFDEIVIDKIENICPDPTLWYGSDPDGIKKAKEITDLTGWNSITTPAELLPDINDTYGYCKRFGLKGLEQFMKQNNLI